jgi:hypothetical protein
MQRGIGSRAEIEADTLLASTKADERETTEPMPVGRRHGRMSGISLHEFIDRHRGRILALCVQKMKQSSPTWSETDLQNGFDGLIDEIVRRQRLMMESFRFGTFPARAASSH